MRKFESILCMKNIYYIGILLFLVSCHFSCSKKNTPKDSWDDTLSSGVIKIASDADFKTLIDAEIAVFESRSDFQAIIYPIYTNEKEAIRLLVEDSVRLVIATRDLNSQERLEVQKKTMEVRKHLIAFDGIALITNKSNQDSIIGIPTLKKILSGEITEWSQINPKTQLGTIRVLFDSKESGVLRYMVDSVASRENLTPNMYALNSNIEVMERVIEMPNTIGIIGVNILSDEADALHLELRNKIQLMWVSNEENATKENSYLPYAGDVREEKYPLWRPVYVLISDPRSGLSSGFSIFLSNEIGQKIVLKSGLLPVSDPHILPVYRVNTLPPEEK